MRIAVISDVHGNRVALDAAVEDIRTMLVDRIVCLGDTVQGGAEPVETIEKLRELNCPIVMGNADDWLLKEESDSVEPTTKEQLEIRAWTISKLSTRDLDFLRGYKSTVEIKLDQTSRFFCFHGSPTSYDDILLPDTPNETWDKLLGPYSPAVMAGGHTHAQQLRRVGGGLFFNPGSVGSVFDQQLPRDSFHADAWAEYAILSSDKGRTGVEFRRVPYDLDRLIRAVRASGRPYAERMIEGYTAQR
jgi:putative phosphoesterase